MAPRIDTEDNPISLQQLDPSPVDDDLSNDNSYFTSSDKPFPPPSLTRSSTSSLGLSGGHSTVFYLTRIQRYSSYISSIFLTFHLTNNAIIPLITRSVPASEPYLLLTRPYYQSPLAEPFIVLLPFTAHILSGIALRIYRRVHLARRYGADSSVDRRRLAWPKLSGTSALGYVLTPFVVGHAFVNRLLPWWVEGGSSMIGLGYVGHGFARYPAVSWLAYTGLMVVASWHIVWGAAKWLDWTPDRVRDGAGAGGLRRRKRRWYAVNASSALLAALWIAGGLGVVARAGEVQGWVGRGYDELFRRIPIMGRWI